MATLEYGTCKLAKEKLVDDFDFNASRETSFCESCVEGKHHRSRFPVDGGKRSSDPLGLVVVMFAVRRIQNPLAVENNFLHLLMTIPATPGYIS